MSLRETQDQTSAPWASPSALTDLSEELISLSKAATLLPRVNGRKPAVCTLWRWCRKGLRGQFLDYVRVGRKICTTHEALMRFFTDLAEIDERIEPNSRSTPPFLKQKPVTSRRRSEGRC